MKQYLSRTIGSFHFMVLKVFIKKLLTLRVLPLICMFSVWGISVASTAQATLRDIQTSTTMQVRNDLMPLHFQKTEFKHNASVNYIDLWRQGLAIFQTLELQPAELSFAGKVFTLPMLSWSFEKQEKLESILRTLAQKKHPFHYVDVVNGLLLLQADLPKVKVLMQLRAVGHEAYSGYLSIIAYSEEANLMSSREDSLGSDEPLLTWLMQEAQVLMDIQTHTSQTNREQRQWIFLTSYDAQFLQDHIRQQLQESAWLEQGSMGLALNQWYKGAQVIHYYVDKFEKNTTLYLNYSTSVKGDI